MIVLLDSNIYIAAALQDGFSAYIVEILAENPNFTIIVSEEILIELEQKLREKFNWFQEDIKRYINGTKKISQLIEVKEKLPEITRDPKDNKILECAVAGNADLIVTLDQDLIKLKTFREIAIIHPKTFSWTFPEHFKKN